MRLSKSPLFIVLLALVFSFGVVARPSLASNIAKIQDTRANATGYLGCFYPKFSVRPVVIATLSKNSPNLAKMQDWRGYFRFLNAEYPLEGFPGSDSFDIEARDELQVVYGFAEPMTAPRIVTLYNSTIEVITNDDVYMADVLNQETGEKSIAVECMSESEWDVTYPKVVKDEPHRSLFQYLTHQFKTNNVLKTLLKALGTILGAAAALLSIFVILRGILKGWKNKRR